ncbi:TetR/AcrR family transcriptional regulator [Aquabacterium sp.]|uniref:TetR/AcrR family transcriptional regulator n=1 Tax=Aquabacterium sp. TaxID=1872578 RepID=UPI0037837A3F
MPRRTSTDDIVDRRVQRTRNALRSALMDLMVERGWDAIDVQTLCDRADIGRSTFYQHYSNKEELLKQNFAGLRDALLVHASQRGTRSQIGFVWPLLEHVHEFQAVFRALIGRRSGHYVQDRFRELLVELVQAGQSRPARRPGSWQVEARAHYLAGALFEMLVWWLGSNRPHRPQEIWEVFEQWSQSVPAAQG